MARGARMPSVDERKWAFSMPLRACLCLGFGFHGLFRIFHIAIFVLAFCLTLTFTFAFTFR